MDPADIVNQLNEHFFAFGNMVYFIYLANVNKSSPIKKQNTKKLDKNSEHVQSQLINKQNPTSVKPMSKTGTAIINNSINIYSLHSWIDCI
jgi:hypothetical protein